MKLETQKLSLYLHVPFCKTRCSYCDFNTYTNLGFLYGRYTNALRSEIERTLASVAHQGYVPLAPLPLAPESVGHKVGVDTVFLGGGTPSLLPPTLLEKIMQAIQHRAELLPQAEITAEANPGTLSLDKLRAMRDMGINRLSFGVQTFDDGLLKSLGRTHNGAGAIEAYEQARRAGFDNLNLDFMFGLPGQTLQGWRATLERAISLRPEHLSLYALTIEEDTAMGRAVARGTMSPPEDDLQADMYLLATDLLGAAGYVQYEISNWALPGKACRHNLVYWRNQPYIGFGPGAHSSFAGTRYAVLKDPQEYIARLEKGQSVIEIEEAEPITPQLKLADTVILALRLNEGLALTQLEAEFGRPLDQLYPGTVDRLTEMGLLEDFEDEAAQPRLRLTGRGRLLSNEVFIRFLPD